ncbi:MAG: hypothetical protein QNL43_02915 [Crocinitomicaceae bacterium]|jgi:hypothetical protein|tara:strand:+ start:9163 stop:9477 length:315 start_codon:yes stop_codon:yes gene_type:complete
MPKFQIQKLEFNSFNDWISLQGNIVKGFLKSEYTLKIDVSQTNRLLNAIQKINPDVSIYDYLISYTDKDYSEYKFNFEKISGNELSFSELQSESQSQDFKMIRA